MGFRHAGDSRKTTIVDGIVPPSARISSSVRASQRITHSPCTPGLVVSLGKALAIIHQVLLAKGDLSGESEARMKPIAQIFVPDANTVAAPGLALVAAPEADALREAS
jgi:hypothetical protein